MLRIENRSQMFPGDLLVLFVLNLLAFGSRTVGYTRLGEEGLSIGISTTFTKFQDTVVPWFSNVSVDEHFGL